MKSLSFLWLLLLHVDYVVLYSTGPDPGACSSFNPSGHGTSTQTSPSPFQVSFSPQTYAAGDTITVTITGLCDKQFKGFLVEARRADPSLDQNEMIGTFTAVTGSKTMCPSGGLDHALSHDSPAVKSSVSFQWTAPTPAAGHLYFIATVVEVKTRFWEKITSDILVQTGIAAPTFASVATTLLSPCPVQGSRFAKPSTCGSTTGCYYDCDSSNLCSFVVTWKDSGANIDFQIMAANTATGDQWMGIAFSNDNKMGTDAVTECVVVSGTMSVKNSYNDDHDNDRLINADAGLSGISGSQVDNIFQCAFSKEKTGSASTKLFDLNNDYYILFGSGPASASGAINQHYENPLVSSTVADLQSLDEIQAVPQTYLLVKVHGSLMVIAWILAGSIGLIMARYFKPMWPQSKLFGEKVWFQIHRGCMIIAFLATVSAFIIIFVYVGDFSEMDETTNLKIAHPIIGIIVTVLVIVNPIMAMFRPHPNTKNRPIFNWGHWGVGSAAYILGVVNCFIGVRMGKPNIPEYVVYILAAFVVWQLLVQLVLEVHQCFGNKKGSQEYEMQQNGDTHISQPRVQKGSGFKVMVLAIHVLVVCGFCIAIIVIMAIA